jgi:hypothetical protein
MVAVGVAVTVGVTGVGVRVGALAVIWAMTVWAAWVKTASGLDASRVS